MESLLEVLKVLAGVIAGITGLKLWTLRARRRQAQAEASLSETEASAQQFSTVDQIVEQFTARLAEMGMKISELTKLYHEQQLRIAALQRENERIAQELKMEQEKTVALTKQLEKLKTSNAK